MGTLTYAGNVFEFDDRDLAHIEIVITSKLRRRENFTMSWQEPYAHHVRTTIWLDAAIPLLFRYERESRPTINREWLNQMSMAANTATGLTLTTKPDNHQQSDLDYDAHHA